MHVHRKYDLCLDFRLHKANYPKAQSKFARVQCRIHDWVVNLPIKKSGKLKRIYRRCKPHVNPFASPCRVQIHKFTDKQGGNEKL
jgi:hypothetical protein